MEAAKTGDFVVGSGVPNNISAKWTSTGLLTSGITIDNGEDFLSAAYRELEEETSIKNVKLIKEIDGTITYELPTHLLGIIWKGKYRGQKQKWFIVKFMGKDNEINLKTNNPEFIEWKWLDIESLPGVIVEFKKKVYEELLPKIRDSIN